jgi:hypothetical protein
VSVNPSLVSWIEKMTEIGLEKRFSKARDALRALKSGNIQRADDRIANVRKIAKPRHSRIQVSKSATELNIKIPAVLVRRPLYSAFLGIFLLLIFSPVILALLLGNLNTLVIPVIIISLLVKLCGNNQITFERQQFEIIHQIFGWNYWRRTGEKSEILGAFLYYKGSEGYQIKIRCDNNRGTYCYVLANNLKEIEAAWLAQEIQDWLSLR